MSGRAQTNRGTRRAARRVAPASASAAKIQKLTTPTFAQPGSTLMVEAVWRDHCQEARSNRRRVFQ